MKNIFTRKDFLVSSCKAGCGLIAGLSVLSSVESCSSIKVFKVESSDGKIQIPLTEFTETNIRIIRVANLEYDIMVAKKTDGSYSAVYMRCTHQDWQLTANTKGLNCSMHGSSFDLDGNVLVGPATNPLKKFTVSKTNTHLILS
jgi:cytochrome b6-f complex iron-sulfur subunit